MSILYFPRLIDEFCILAVSADPFRESESNPLETHAIESSLWELETLQQHVLPTVSKAASFIHKPLPTVERDLTEFLDDSYDKVRVATKFVCALTRLSFMV